MQLRRRGDVGSKGTPSELQVCRPWLLQLLSAPLGSGSGEQGSVAGSAEAPASLTPAFRAALRLVVEAQPAGSSVLLVREHVLALLGEATPAQTGVGLETEFCCKAVGEILGRHDSTIRSMCYRGEFPGAYRQNGREWRIPTSAIREYQTTQRRGSYREKRDAPSIKHALRRWRSA
jgi:hypothetical protein